MKKIILTILILAFCVSISGAGITDQMRRVIAAKNGAGGCSYADTLIGGDNSSGGSGGWNTAFWVAIQFTVGEEHTCVRKIKVLEHADGDSCASVKSGYAILGDTGGNKPAGGNVITSGTASVSYTGDAGITEVVDLGAGNEVTLATGTYWIAFIYSDVAQSETCGMKTPYVTSGATWLCEMSSSTDSDTVPADWSSSSCSPGWGLGLAVYE